MAKTRRPRFVGHLSARNLTGQMLWSILLTGSALAQSTLQSTSEPAPASPWDRRQNTDAVQADAVFDRYKFRDLRTQPLR